MNNKLEKGKRTMSEKMHCISVRETLYIKARILLKPKPGFKLR